MEWIIRGRKRGVKMERRVVEIQREKVWKNKEKEGNEEKIRKGGERYYWKERLRNVEKDKGSEREGGE